MQIESNNITWKNLSNPDISELNTIGKQLAVSPAVIRDLLAINKRPKIEEYHNYLFLVIHFPVFNEETRQTVATELDFIITSNSIFTIYQSSNPALEKFFNELDTDGDQRTEHFKSAGFLLFSILDQLIDSCLPMLDHIHEKIEDIENQVFDGREKEMLKEIAIVKRDIIDFRRTIKPQRSVLELLSKKTGRFFKDDLDIISQEVIGSEVRVWNTLENHMDMIEAIESTNNSLLSFQINQVMHTLTFFSIIIFSLTFVASFFSMKIFETPVLPEYPLDLWFISGIMLFVVITVSLIFKRKKWM